MVWQNIGTTTWYDELWDELAEVEGRGGGGNDHIETPQWIGFAMADLEGLRTTQVWLKSDPGEPVVLQGFDGDVGHPAWMAVELAPGMGDTNLLAAVRGCGELYVAARLSTLLDVRRVTDEPLGGADHRRELMIASTPGQAALMRIAFPELRDRRPLVELSGVRAGAPPSELAAAAGKDPRARRILRRAARAAGWRAADAHTGDAALACEAEAEAVASAVARRTATITALVAGLEPGAGTGVRAALANLADDLDVASRRVRALARRLDTRDGVDFEAEVLRWIGSL